MVTYLLIGLVFYLIALYGNPGLVKSLKKNTIAASTAGILFILFWFPIFVGAIFFASKKKWEERDEQS